MAILLAVLKWTGIVLLALIVIVLVLLLLVLFVPVRYYVKADFPEKEPGFDGAITDGMQVRAGFHWLLRFLRGSFAYPDDKVFRVKVLFFTVYPRPDLPDFRLLKGLKSLAGKGGRALRRALGGGAPETPAEQGAAGAAEGKTGMQTKAAEAAFFEESAEMTAPEAGDTESGIAAPEAGDTESGIAAPEEGDTENRSAAQDAGQTESSTAEKDAGDTDADGTAADAAKQTEGGTAAGQSTESAADKAQGQIAERGADKAGIREIPSLFDLMGGFFSLLLRLFLFLLSLIFKPYEVFLNFWYTISGICDKIGMLKSLLESESFERAKTALTGESGTLLKKLLPRRTKIRLTVGTGDPATTGQMLGVYGVLSGIAGKHLLLRGDFDRQVIEGQVRLKGQITVFRIVWCAAKLYFDKDIRRVMKRFQKIRSG